MTTSGRPRRSYFPFNMADEGEDWGGEHQVKNYRSFTQGYLNLSCLNR